MEQTFVFNYSSEAAFNIGDYLYGVVPVERQYFSSPCPICNDTKKVVLQDKEFPCPNCCSYASRSINATNTTINNYVVKKFKINSIEFKTSDESYSSKAAPIMYISAFTKIKAIHGYDTERRGASLNQIVTISGVESCDDLHDAFCSFCKSRRRYTFYDEKLEHFKQSLFSDYDTAVLYARYLNEREMKLLDKFNNDNNCNYTVNFEQKNDKREKAECKPCSGEKRG